MVCVVLALMPSALPARQVSPDRMSLSEQFDMRYFVHDRIVAALPGYVGFEDHAPCDVIVYLADTLGWADSARALFRHALPADTVVYPLHGCTGPARVRVRQTRYSLAELSAFAERVAPVLREPSLRLRGWVGIKPDSLVVTAHSRPALERARARLARLPGVPRDILAYAVSVPEEVDGPVAPPREAYLAVIDTIMRSRQKSGGLVLIAFDSLPQALGDSDLVARGARLRTPADACATNAKVTFLEPRQWVDGMYAFTTVEGSTDFFNGVRCTGSGCVIERRVALDGDGVVTGCVSAEFGIRRLDRPRRSAGSPAPKGH
jgi:hypothetical protein